MYMKRYWMTGCMAVMLLGAARCPNQVRRDALEASGPGWITVTSKHSVDDTVRHIHLAARDKHMEVIAQADAQNARGEMLDSSQARVLVLGDTSGQTPAVQSDQQAVPDLPLTVLVRQGKNGQTEVSYSNPRTLRRHRGAPRDWAARLVALPKVIKAALA